MRQNQEDRNIWGGGKTTSIHKLSLYTTKSSLKKSIETTTKSTKSETNIVNGFKSETKDKVDDSGSITNLKQQWARQRGRTTVKFGRKIRAGLKIGK